MLPAHHRSSLSRVVALANGKGGVGKSSAVANLAGLAAAAGYKVLAVDLDPQGNLGEDLGYTANGTDDGAGLAEAVLTGKALSPTAAVRERLDVVPGGDALDDLSDELVIQARDRGLGWVTDALATSLAPVAGGYDLVLLDTPPGERWLQRSALGAAKWLVIPTRSDSSSRKGLAKLGRRFSETREHNGDLELLGVFLFGVTQSARRVRQRAREVIAEDFGDQGVLFDSWIRYAEAAAEDARRRGQLAHELEREAAAARPWYEALHKPRPDEGPRLAASSSSVAADYQALADELLSRLAEGEKTVLARGAAR